MISRSEGGAVTETVVRDTEPHKPGLPEHWVVFSIAAAAVFLMSFDSTLVPIALGKIGEGVHRTAPSQLSWIVTTYTIAMASTLVAVGRIGDRKGRRTTFMIGLALFTTGSIVGGCAVGYWMVLLGRVIQGLGAAFVFPSSLALVLAVWPKDESTRVIAMWTAVGAVAGALGPSVGTGLVDWLGWRSAFLVHVPVAVLAFVRTFGVRVDTEKVAVGSFPDVLGIVLAAFTLGATALVLAQGRSWGFDDPAVLTSIATVAVLGPVVWWRCNHHPAPIVEPRLFRLRTYRRCALLSIVIPAGIFANFAMMPRFLQRVWGYDTFGAGMAIVPFSVAASLTAIGVVRVAKRLDERSILLFGLVLMVATMIFLRLVPTEEPQYWTHFFPAVLGAGVGGWGIGLSMMNGIGARDLDGTNYGVGVAILMTARQCGALAGIATAFGILGDTSEAGRAALDQLHEVWLFLIPLFLVALVLAWRIPRRAPLPTSTPEGASAP
jgi:EmrB/QacA subfamily drug resistance transporter